MRNPSLFILLLERRIARGALVGMAMLVAALLSGVAFAEEVPSAQPDAAEEASDSAGDAAADEVASSDDATDEESGDEPVQVAQADTSEEGEGGSGDSSVKKSTDDVVDDKAEEKDDGLGDNAALANALGAMGATAEGLPFGMLMTLTNTVGFSSFLDEDVRNPQYDISIRVSPFYDPVPGHRLGMGISFNKNIVSNSLATSGGSLGISREGEVTVSDLLVSYTALGVVADSASGLRLNLGASALLPTSRFSQTRDLYATVRAQATLLGIWDWFIAAYTFRVGKAFHRYTHLVIDDPSSNDNDPNNGDPTDVDDPGVVSNRCTSINEIDGNCIVGGFSLVEWSFLNSFFMSFNVIPKLSLNVSFAVVNVLGYEGADDAVVSDNSNSNANQRQRDIMFGSIGLNYQVNSYLATTLSMATTQAPFSPDNKTLRFPFFSDRADNSTVFSLQLTGSF